MVSQHVFFGLLVVVASIHYTTAAKNVRTVSARWQHFKDRLTSNETLRRQLSENAKFYNLPPKPTYVEFTCTPEKSLTRPTSAHKVRPADIDVVAAVGDSITAAFALGSTDIFDVIREDRGESWCIGGDKDLEAEVITLPNILKKFNPALEGFSFGEADEDEPGAKFNVAISGNEAKDMPANVQKLVDRMQNDNGVDWENHWKMITFLIGGNDLCGVCDDQEDYSPDRYIGFVREALNNLHQNVPRAIVNLNTMFDVTQLPAFSDGLACDVIQDTVCYCGANKEHHPLLRDTLRAYNQKLIELIDSGRYDTREDFTVILHDHFSESSPPKEPGTGKIDRSYWAQDCFHPGRKAHYAFGTSLWNTLMEPVGQKRSKLTWEIGGKLACPTIENPYIWTRLNSPPVSTPAIANNVALQEVKDGTARKFQTTPTVVSAILIGLAVGIVASVVAVALFIVRRRKQKQKQTLETGVHENPAFEKH